MFAATAKKIASLLVIATLLYAMSIVLLIVPAVNGLAPILFKQQTGRTLQFRDITFNPFTLAVVIDGGRNDNPDGSTFIAFDRLVADLSLRSLWRELTLDELRIDGLEAHVVQTAPERFNFSDILDHRQPHNTQPAADAAKTNTPALLTVNRLHLSTKQLSLRAPHQATPLNASLDKLALDIDGFTTLDLSDKELSDKKSSDKKIEPTLPQLAIRRLQLAMARADIELPRADGNFKTHIANLQGGLELFSTYGPESQPFTLALDDESGGHIRANGQVSLASAQSRGDFDIQKLSLLPAYRYLSERLHFDLDKGNASLAGRFTVDWKKAVSYRADVRSARVDNVQMQARDDAETGIALHSLAVKNIGVDGNAHSANISDIAVDGLQVRGWNRDTQISLLDMLKVEPNGEEEPPSAPWSVLVQKFALGDSRVDWRTDAISTEQLAITPLQFNATNVHWPDAQPAAINLSAAINTDTRLAVQGSFTPADLSGALQGEIKALPLTWGNRYLEREITATISRGALDARWAMTLKNAVPQQIKADGSVDNFQLLRKSNNSQLAAWQRLDLQQLDVDMNTQHVRVARIDLRKPEARFRINPDGTNNFQELIIHNQPSSTKPATTETKIETKPAAKTAWQALVDRIHLDDGDLDFRDNSLPRPFHALIGHFSGDIANLGSAPEQIARVDLRGTVDDYAPVSLTGTIAPLRPQPELDLALDFTNLDLATFTSYSSKYAGYTIRRGLLSLQLAYTLKDGRLQGRNRIVATRLELGEKVESPKAVDLPLKLAIALLTDENGVIDMDVDVSGKLDDPQFSIGKIVWAAFRNVIVKAVTSPFRLLASLVDGVDEKELGLVDFEAGTDHIQEASRANLGKLTAALAKRPGLQLRVIGHADPGADAAAMKEGKLAYFLQKEGVGEDDLQARNRSWSKAVEKLYEKTFPDRKIGDQTPDQLAIALRDNMTLGNDAMDWIAGRRALAVKRALVIDLGVATDRVLIDAVPASESKNPHAQAELKVDY